MRLGVQSMLETGFSNTRHEFKILLVRPVGPEAGPISAEGKVLNTGRRIGAAEGRFTDSTGPLFAHGTTTCRFFPS
jgi:acyl-coenzyme A thioesterase PaaI-like protein